MAIYGARNARRAMIDTVFFRALSQAATILGFIVLVRSMPEQDFGVLHLLYAFIPVVSTVASLGLEQMLRRYEPEYLSTGDVPAARWLVRFIASTRFAANLVILGAILLAWNTVAPVFKLAPYRDEFLLFSVLVLLHFQARIMRLSLAANMLHRFSVGSMAVLAIAKLVVYSGFAWFDQLTLQRAILADTAGFALAYGLMLYARRRYCPQPAGPRYRPDASERKRLFRYGALNNFNDAGTLTLSAKADNFFIAAIFDPIGVAIYAFYTRLDEMVRHLQPVSLFQNVVQPLFFSVRPADADRRIPHYFSLLLNTNLLYQLPVLAFVTAYHHELVAIVFGGRYGDYSVLLPMIMGFGALGTIATPVTLVAQYEEKAGIILLSKIFAIYNVGALLVLLPVWGVHGAVVATGSATLFKNLFIWWHVRARARWLNFGPMLFSSVLTWGGAVGACLLLKQLPRVPMLLDVLLGVLVVGVAWLIYVRTPAISESDRNIMGSVFRGKEARFLHAAGILGPAQLQP
jgi:O-antigen/teichoic acid export membrane protein